MSIRWIPLYGEVEFKGSDVIFKGNLVDVKVGGETRKQAAVGRILSNQIFNGGTISVDVKLSRPATDLETSGHPLIAEILVFTDPVTGNSVNVGIGGDFYLFAARMWDNVNMKWVGPIMKGGLVSRLNLDEPHTISVNVQSSHFRLSIDGVHLGAADAPFPIVGSQVGLFAQSVAEVKFSNLVIDTEKPKVFVVMPFSPPYNDLYDYVFYPVAERCQLDIHRSDKTYGPGLIIADIVQQIMQAQVIIAEITPNPANPNVYFEVGFAMAMRKPLVLIADRDCPNELPFDISPFRVMFYENKIAGKTPIQLELVKHLNAILPAYGPVASYYHELLEELNLSE